MRTLTKVRKTVIVCISYFVAKVSKNFLSSQAGTSQIFIELEVLMVVASCCATYVRTEIIKLNSCFHMLVS